MHIGDLHAETEEPKTEHQITWFCCSVWGSIPGYLFDPQREKRRVERGRFEEGLRERLGFVCFTGGGGHQDGTEHILCYSMGHMDAIHCSHSFLQQSIFLNDFGLTGLGHTQSLAFFNCIVWLVCVSWLKFCHRTFWLISHYNRQICVHSALQQLIIPCHSNSVRAEVVVPIQCEIAHTLFLFSTH